MINGLNIFYTKVNIRKGLKLIENKGSGCYMTKNNTNNYNKKISQTGRGLKILKEYFI